MAGAAGVAFLPGNSLALLNNGDRFYPAMLEGDRGGEVFDHRRGLHLLGRRMGLTVRERARRGGRARRARQDSARCGRLGQRRRRDPADPREGRLPRRLVQPGPHRPPAAHQQPHAPQVADHRRPHRLHRRRRHRRSLDRRRAGRQALARLTDPDRRARRAAAANGLRAELAGSHLRAGDRAGLLSVAERRRARSRCRRS